VLIAEGVANGDTQTVKVRVRVVPEDCDSVLSDSVLNDPEVRTGLRQALAASTPGATPESMQRLEQNGVVWRGPDGTIYLEDTTDPYGNTPCFSYDRDSLASRTPPIPGSTPLGYYHTHPNVIGDYVYGCLPSAPGRPWPAQFPGDIDQDTHLPREPNVGVGCDATGGGSPGDWAATDSTGFPHWIICADGRVVRLDPGALTRSGNPNKWYWNKAECTWPL